MIDIPVGRTPTGKPAYPMAYKQDLLHACDIRQMRTGRGAKHHRTTIHSARQILFHLGILDSEVGPTTVPALSLEERMADVPATLRPALVTCLHRKRATCTPKAVSSLATRLAHSGRYLAVIDPRHRLADRPGPPPAHRAVPHLADHRRQHRHR
ncbi:hypothetical protein [Rhodococcus zopfii]|uniref:hypothetical protein n=1 Tax=Rhodococcus zopfii TaxID=43772 RepID=UPI000AC54D59|nr:hypothetical protein [Rhodococcus zopfii]